MKDTVVFYHKNCTDGWTAAWAAWRALGDGADYVPLDPDEPPPDGLEGKAVYFLDLCPRRDTLDALMASCRCLAVLDHHKSAVERGAGLPGFVYDVRKCGARLAWEHFHPDAPAPFLIDVVEDRDLWKWQLPESRALSAYLGTVEKTFDDWDALCDGMRIEACRQDFVLMGGAILRYQEALVRRLAATATPMQMGGHTVPAVNTPLFQSEVGHALCQNQPFAVCWYEKDGKRVYSLRSADEGGIDVSAVAVAHGGGGHYHAAGFSVPLPEAVPSQVTKGE